MKTEYLLLGFILAGLFTLYGCGYNPTKDAMEICLTESGSREVSVSATDGKTDRVVCEVGARIDTGI